MSFDVIPGMLNKNFFLKYFRNFFRKNPQFLFKKPYSSPVDSVDLENRLYSKQMHGLYFFIFNIFLDEKNFLKTFYGAKN